MKLRTFCICAALLLALSACAAPDPGSASRPEPSGPVSAAPSETPEPAPTSTPEPTPAPDPIQTQLDGMTTEQKVGQLLLAGISGTEAGDDARYAVETVQVGGIILFGRNVESCNQAVRLTNGLRAMNGEHIPLFLAVDEEGGSVSRMPEEIDPLPAAYTFGAQGDPALCRELGTVLAARCGALGANLDFASVADVWSNPDNTVIGKRAFSSDPDTAARMAAETAAGLTDGGVIPVAKHFPGHGDTAADSHYDLPVVDKTPDELEALELIPFRTAVENGAPAVMVAHLLVTALDAERPASLSPAVVTGLLREELGFDGVVFTDDLTMGAVTGRYGMGEAAVLAVEAGCDVLLVCHGQDELRQAYEALLAAVDSGRVTAERLDESVYRILKLKSDYALTNAPAAEPDTESVNRQTAELRQWLQG